MNFLLDLACEVIRDRRNAICRFGGNHFPVSLQNIRVVVGRVRRNREEADLRVVGGLDFLIAISCRAERHLHVGLASTQPDISNQHVVKFDSFMTGDLDRVRAAHSRRLNLHLPAAIRPSYAGCVLACNFDPNLVARF